jgi:hypothetical protein
MSSNVEKSVRMRAQLRENILLGMLDLPEQIIQLSGAQERHAMETMFSAMWHRFLNNKSSTSTVYWYDKFESEVVFNNFLYHLTHSGWATVKTLPTKNWSEIELNESKLLEFVSKDLLDNVRRSFKFNKYRMTNTSATKFNVTKLLGKKQDTGIVRDGIGRAGNSQFSYDTKYIEFYRDAIELNLTKSMRELGLDAEEFNDDIDYASVSKEILDFHIENPNQVFTTGENVNDSRGRAISSALSKVFNPISSKDARSLIVINDSRDFNDSHLEPVYLFIAELIGSKQLTMAMKAIEGKRCYKARKLHDLDLVTHQFKDEEAMKIEKERADNDRKELHENIWLERLYDELDRYNDYKESFYNSQFKYRILMQKLSRARVQKSIDSINAQIKEFMDANPVTGFNWTVPIELDATASMLQIQGALLNHATFLEKTNCSGKILQDIWTVNGVPRKQFKDAATPMLYGSSQTVKALWANKKHKFTREQLEIASRELNKGVFQVAKLFKDFIIKNVQPKEVMKVKIWGEEFTIKCNRYKHKGDYKVRYNIFDSASNKVKTIWHMHTVNVPDLQQFKRFFVTLICHNLDSRVMNHICKFIDWILPIHDAAVVSPIDASQVRALYCSQIDAIHKDRVTILSEYFESIGIDSSSAMDWKKVKEAIVPAIGFKCQPMAMK